MMAMLLTSQSLRPFFDNEDDSADGEDRHGDDENVRDDVSDADGDDEDGIVGRIVLLYYSFMVHEHSY